MNNPVSSDWLDRYRFFRGFEPASVSMRLASSEIVLRYGIKECHIRVRWEEDPVLDCDNKDHTAMGVILERQVQCGHCGYAVWVEVDSLWGIDLDGPEDVTEAKKRLMEALLADEALPKLPDMSWFDEA